MELKNDLAIIGTLHSVDQYLNVKLNNTRVVNEAKYPHMVGGREEGGGAHLPTLHALPAPGRERAALNQAALDQPTPCGLAAPRRCR